MARLEELEAKVALLEVKVTDIFKLIGMACPMTRYYKKTFENGRFVNVELSRDDLRREIKNP